MADSYWKTNGNADTNSPFFDPEHPANFLGTTDNKPLVIETNGKEAMYIDPQGHVGMGTTKPDAKLQVRSLAPQIHATSVASPIADVPVIIRLTTGGTLSQLGGAVPGTTWDIKNDANMHFSTTSVGDVMTLTKDGDVGVGTTQPVAKLEVSSSSPAGEVGFPQLRIKQETLGSQARLYLTSNYAQDPQGGTTAEVSWAIVEDPNNSTLAFASYPDEQDPAMVMTRSDGVTIYPVIKVRSSVQSTNGGRIDMGAGWSIEESGFDLKVYQKDLAGPNTGKLLFGNELFSTKPKHFVQDHPTDPTKEIVYTSLEGSEAGTYMRGTWKLENGKAVIELPEHFSMVTSEDGLTVQLTPRGEWLQLYVVRLNTKQIVVQEAQGKSGQFDYFIQGVRKGYEHYEVVREK